MLRIYGRTDSINVMKVLWTCEELGVAFERVDVGGRFGFAAVPEYARLNPNVRVPTIDHDGFVLWESNVIVRYLGDAFPAAGLRGGGHTRWLEEQWMDWQQTTLAPPLRTFFWQRVRTPPERRDPGAEREARHELHRIWPMLDDHLRRHWFVAGDRFTVADIPVGCAAYRWYALDDDRPSTPALDDWWSRLRGRPGYRKHLTLPLT